MKNKKVLLLLPVDSKISSLDSTIMGYHSNEVNVFFALSSFLPTLTSLRNNIYGNVSNDFNLRIDINNIPGIISRELFRSNIRDSLWNILYFVDTDQLIEVLNDYLLKYVVNGSLIHQQIESVFEEHQRIIQYDPSGCQSFFYPQLYHKKVIKVIDHSLFDVFYIDVWIRIIMQLTNRYKQGMIHNIYKRNDSLYPMTESLVESMHAIDIDNFDNVLHIRYMLQVIDLYKILNQKMINPKVPRNVHVFIEEQVIEFIQRMDGQENDQIYSFFSQMLFALSNMIFESHPT